MTMLDNILAEDRRNVGFVEGPGNENPWGREQGIPNASYCDSGGCVVCFHNGYNFRETATYGKLGFAYTPAHVNDGVAHGEFRYDHASLGDPADVLAGDFLFYAWRAGQSYPDHVERAQEDCPSNGRTHNIGYNTGNPEGVKDLWRDRTYLLGRLRPIGLRDMEAHPAPPPPPPAPPEEGPGWPGRFMRRGMGGDDVRAFQQRLKDRGWRIGVDGDFGPETDRVTRQFQADKSLEQDGVVGPATWGTAMRTDNIT